MPVNIQTDIIKEIADLLDMGMLAFYHLETGELISYPDEMRHANFEPSEWRKEIKAVRKDQKKFIRFEPTDTGHALRIMRHFTGNINDPTTRQLFEEVLNNRKPFQGFKQLLWEFPDLQQDWYTYKTEQNIQWVQNQLQAYNADS